MHRLPNVLDIEASGFSPEGYPIEVGFVLADGTRFCRLIDPPDHWQHWDEEAEALHGIDRATLLENGVTPQALCRELNFRLKGLRLYSDGWVLDQRWLDQLFGEAGIRAEFYLSPIESIQSECQYLLWDRVKAELRSKISAPRHRASNDAEFIQALFVATALRCETELQSHAEP